MGCHFILWGIFPGLLHYRQILYCMSYQGSPYLLDNWFIIKRYSLEQPDQRDAKGKVCVCVLGGDVCTCSVLSNSLQPQGLARLCFPWNFPGKNTGVGCHFLLQGIFLTQELNPCFLQWQADSLPPSHLGSSLSGAALSKSAVY